MTLFKSYELKKAERELKQINKLEKSCQKLTDEELKQKTQYFKDLLKKGKTLDDIRVEAFAVAREATKRVLKKRPFDVQIIGGLVLDYGSVAEMKTGEGKTIAAVAPAYLNSLSGKGVIISTVNEYLTQRDGKEMGEVFKFLGVSVGINIRELSSDEKRAAYNADITYSVHSEVGFDYLRDNMVKDIKEKVQRGFNFALIDEVDSILIDEAKTPLIITGGDKFSSAQYKAADVFVKGLGKDDYEIDWETKGIQLTETGINKANNFFGVKNFFSIQCSELVHRVQNSLRANWIMQKDVEYIVKEGKILLVDAFTGRIMEGRSYSDGLQQAIQAKEGVEIEPETKTLATITYQNLFRMFAKLSGMTGTAKTEEEEFIEIYNMRVHVIPTNRPMIRKDHPDVIFADQKYKYDTVVEDIKKRYEKGQPVLVGTAEVSESEMLSARLKKIGIPHTVLNAKQNAQEAEIIKKAGRLKAITIATNMAGRGTDIVIDKEVVKLGGLYVLGTNKAEARRIDNQLRGRSGRQGDPGESRFYISIDDLIFTRFANHEKLKKLFEDHGKEPITGRLILRSLAQAQKKIEGFNFDARKDILQYDDVIRQQRDLIYAQRDIIISQQDLIEVIRRMIKSVVRDVVDFPDFQNEDGTINIERLTNTLNRVWFGLVEHGYDASKLNGLIKEELISKMQKEAITAYDEIRENIENNLDKNFLFQVEREIILKTFDENWTLHIDQMTKLRSASSLASYAQKNPYQVYIEKGTKLFKRLLERISHNTIRLLFQNRYAIIKPKAPIA